MRCSELSLPRKWRTIRSNYSTLFVNHLLLQMKIALTKNANTRLIIHFSLHFWSRGMFQPAQYQILVDVCRTGSITRTSDMEDNNWSFKRNKKKEKLEKNKKTERFRVVRTMKRNFLWSYSCTFLQFSFCPSLLCRKFPICH